MILTDKILADNMVVGDTIVGAANSGIRGEIVSIETHNNITRIETAIEYDLVDDVEEFVIEVDNAEGGE
jgi:preprotein translocase subunit YajC